MGKDKAYPTQKPASGNDTYSLLELGAWFDGYRTAVKDMKRLSIDHVIYNNPATIVFWSDGQKTVVKCYAPDKYDGRTGVLLCCAKRLLGHDKDWYDQIADGEAYIQVNKNKEEDLGAAGIEYIRAYRRTNNGSLCCICWNW